MPLDPEPRLLPPLVDGELELHLAERTLGDPARNRVPAYLWEMRIDHARIGTISLRLGQNDYLDCYAGNIGYGVDSDHRGHHYAARACRLVFEVARSHGFKILWITCNPQNVASRRTCEIVGGQLVGIVDLPAETDMYREGDRQKCRYRFVL